MPVPFLLLPILKYHRDAQYKERIYADDAKCRSEDEIEVSVCELRERADTSALLRSDERICAGTILDKRR